MSTSGSDRGWQTESEWRDRVAWELPDGAGRSPPGGSRRSTSGVIGTILAGLVAILGVIAWMSATSPVEDPPTEPVAAAEATVEPVGEPGPDLSDPALDIDAAVEFVETRASASFRQMLTETAASMGIAYRSGDQLTLLDFARGEIAPMAESVQSRSVPAVELFRAADGRTYAVDAATREATLVAGGGHVVETLWPGLVARTASQGPIVGPGERATVGPLDGRAPQVDVALREGARLLPLPGFGLVLVSADGSDLVGPDVLVHLSDNEIVSATPRGWLERVTTGAESTLQVVDTESAEPLAVLPDTFGQPDAHYLLSPDVAHVLRIDADGSSELYSLADGGVTWVIGDGMQEPRWAPDSSFIVWLDTVAEEAKLKIMFLEPRAWIAVGLAEIGAGLPDGAELVIVS